MGRGKNKQAGLEFCPQCKRRQPVRVDALTRVYCKVCERYLGHHNKDLAARRSK